jgi:hypothetical protein
MFNLLTTMKELIKEIKSIPNSVKFWNIFFITAILLCSFLLPLQIVLLTQSTLSAFAIGLFFSSLLKEDEPFNHYWIYFTFIVILFFVIGSTAIFIESLIIKFNKWMDSDKKMKTTKEKFLEIVYVPSYTLVHEIYMMQMLNGFVQHSKTFLDALGCCEYCLSYVHLKKDFLNPLKELIENLKNNRFNHIRHYYENVIFENFEHDGTISMAILRELRSSKTSKEDLCKKLNWSTEKLDLFLSGKNHYTLSIIKEIQTALNINLFEKL